MAHVRLKTETDEEAMQRYAGELAKLQGEKSEYLKGAKLDEKSVIGFDVKISKWQPDKVVARRTIVVGDRGLVLPSFLGKRVQTYQQCEIDVAGKGCKCSGRN